jgi:hypothetical protein
MRKSKFVGTRCGDYVCAGAMVVDVQPKYCRRKVTADGTRAKTRSHHSQQYGYPWEKRTSDGKAIKSIILNAAQTRKVYRGLATVDEFVKRKERKLARTFKDRINYSFCH